MSVKFKDLMNNLPAEKQAKVKAMADDMRMELQLYRIREELELSQKQMAEALSISQPSVVALEKRGNDIKLSSVKRYIEAMGGVLNLSVELPTGKTVTFNLQKAVNILCDFIQFIAKCFFILLIALGTLFLLFAVDFTYILAFLGVYVAIFATCLVVAIIKENNRINKLRIAEQDKNRVKYVIVN